ncbi:MAG: fibronectin type III domain-containing protein [Ignavibacteria bacterium]|nr:fibronectin type III domain-containing protein [Ignavibacteria bacterium]
MIKFLILLVPFWFFGNSDLFALNPKDFALTPKIRISESGSNLILDIEFPKFEFKGSYIVKRKNLLEKFWRFADTLPSNLLNYIDTIPNVSSNFYEYSFSFVSDTFKSFAYIVAGNKTQLENFRGNVLILVDDSLAPKLSEELLAYKSSLEGDFWSVEIRSVPRSNEFNPQLVNSTKRVVNAFRRRWGKNFKALILIGRVPVPYTGNTTLDGHPDHIGAFPSDLFYVLDDSLWQDETDYNVGAIRKENWNVPFDGKFDNSILPSEIGISVGRIDFFNLPDFLENETTLLKRYLEKNINFRFGRVPKSNSGLIDDGFRLSYPEVFSANAWMNFNVLCDTVIESKFSNVLSNEFYRFAYACNAGSFNSIWSSINSEECSEKSINTSFAFLLGSYLWDWDSERNLLRSLLASEPNVVLVAWIGRPFWHFHHFSAGVPFVHSFIQTVNNKDLYPSTGLYGYKGAHISLLGDPTLRIKFPEPPSSFNHKIAEGDTLTLSWRPPSDTTNLLGYLLMFRKDKKDWDSIIQLPATASFYEIKGLSKGKYEFQLKTLFKEYYKYGYYLNPSTGIVQYITIE